MHSSQDRPTPTEARDSLASVDASRRAGLRLAAPTRRFGAAIALLAGGLVATPALEALTFAPSKGIVTLFLIIGMALVINARKERTGTAPKEFPDGRWRTVLMVVGASAVFLLLFAAGVALRDAGGLAWGPLLTGAIGALLVFALSESERRDYLARSAAE